MSGHGIHLDTLDAVEVLDALVFIADWLRSDPNRLEASLQHFTTDHYRLDDLHRDLLRLVEVVGQANGIALEDLGVTQ